jgi:hypothetical protein
MMHGQKTSNYPMCYVSEAVFARKVSCGAIVSRINTPCLYPHFRVPVFYFGCVIDVSPLDQEAHSRRTNY